MSLKRRADDEDLPEQPPTKVQKVEDELIESSDYEEYDSDKSRDDEDFHEYQILDLLAPHERRIISKDPYNTQLFTEIYSNDFSLQKEKVSNLSPSTSADLQLPMDVIIQIFKQCDEVTIFNYSMTSKTSISNAFWKSLFYASRWRVPNEIKNFNLNRSGKNIYNMQITNDIDWFNEYKRNCLNTKRIRDLIQEITTKIYDIIDKKGADWENENDKTIFYAGLSDEELDKWERDSKYLLTNDLRQLYKCCNGAKFRMVDLEGERLSVDWWLHVPDFMLPKLEDVKINEEISVRNVVYNYYFQSERNIEEDDPFEDSILLKELDPLKFPKLHDPQLSLFTERDFESDEDDEFRENSSEEKEKSDLGPGDHEESSTKEQKSDGEYSSESKNSSENSDDEEKISADNGVKILLNFGQCRDYSRPDDDWAWQKGKYDLFYEPITASICTIIRVEPEKEVFFANNYRSIVEWLQEISDHLDDVRAHYFVVPNDRKNPSFTILGSGDLEQMDYDLGDYWENFWWSRMNAEFLTDFYFIWSDDLRPVYTPPRCDKMIAAAGQEFLVKLFQRANQLETENYLRPETLAKAARELGLFNYQSLTETYPAEEKKKND